MRCGLPAEAGHLLAQQPLLRLDVTVVDVEVGRGEGEHGDRSGGVGDRPQPGPAPRLLVVEQPAVQPELVGHGVEGQHQPEVTDELLARPEDHRPQRRVQPVGADHEVEAPPVAAREGDVDPVRVLGELGDPVAEDVLDTVAGVVVQHLGEVSAQDLDLRDVPVAVVVLRAERLQHVPSASTVYAPAVSVHTARTAASSPIRRMTSLATPRASTACPPGRSPGACSTTVTSAPRRCSQWASAGPAMLAPVTNTLMSLIVVSCSSDDCRLSDQTICRISWVFARRERPRLDRLAGLSSPHG